MKKRKLALTARLNLRAYEILRNPLSCAETREAQEFLFARAGDFFAAVVEFRAAAGAGPAAPEGLAERCRAANLG